MSPVSPVYPLGTFLYPFPAVCPAAGDGSVLITGSDSLKFIYYPVRYRKIVGWRRGDLVPRSSTYLRSTARSGSGSQISRYVGNIQHQAYSERTGTEHNKNSMLTYGDYEKSTHRNMEFNRQLQVLIARR